MRYGRVIEYRRRSLLYGFSGPTCRIRGTACYGRSTHKRPPRNDRIRLCTHVCLCVSPVHSFLPVRLSVYRSRFISRPEPGDWGFRGTFAWTVRVGRCHCHRQTILNRLLALKNVDIIFSLFDGPDTCVKLTVLNCIRWNVPVGTRSECEGKG